MNKTFKEPRLLALDFEFNQITSECVNLVSCVTHDLQTKKTRKFWLHNSENGKKELREHLKKYSYMLGFSCVAEARSFYSLNLDPLSFKWLDLFLEYKMLCNHNDKLNWGKQLVNGKIRTVNKPKPKWQRTEEEAKNGFKPTFSLAEATYKLTGQIRDTAEKDAVRDLIISNPKKFTAEEKERILKYNADDVEFLPEIWAAIKNHYAELVPEEILIWEEYFEDALWRGRYAAHTAIMESIGYPINLEATKNFSKQIPAILAECQRDINSQFSKPSDVNKVTARVQGLDWVQMLPFRWNAKKSTYTWDQKVTRLWIEKNCDKKTWMRTDKGQLSLSLEAFERAFAFKHDYPRGNFGAQMVRFLKLKQSLYGFNTKNQSSSKKSFWDSVGPDGRVRPYMNIYGAQSGRSQPAATGFMFLKPAWMRALVEPQEGYYLAGIDYGQQEYFLAGLLSQDHSMIRGYLSGDPYLYLGKEAGMIPPEGTKETHSVERDLMKSTILGILFGMSKIGLSAKLTADSGREISEDEAQAFIEMFEQVYPDYIAWRAEQLALYEEGNAFRTLDGWCLWNDNDNPRSVLNVPIQGAGASIMRKAVDLAVEKGCRVIFTLHDAIYIEAPIGSEDHIVRLRDAMQEGFAYFFQETELEKIAKKIKLDPKAWGRHFPEKGSIKVKGWEVPVSNLYIDKRSLADYQRFSKYFSEPDSEIL
mgnify:CR=1 FL=1